MDTTWNMWAQNVRTYLGSIVRSCSPLLTDALTESIEFVDLKSKRNDKKKDKLFNANEKTLLRDSFSNTASKSNMRITTIHSVKGETLDAVMVVSSIKKNNDGHWEDWLKFKEEEPARFAYVASSRPKYLLVWAVPEEDGQNYTRLTSLGFTRYK
jgi:hypothetical protein